MTAPDNPIRVLHVAHSLVGGGAETQLRYLLQATREDVCLGVWYAEGEGVEMNAHYAYRHRRTGRFDLGMVATIWQSIRAFKPHIVQVWLPPSVTIPAMIGARLSGCKVVFCYRNQMAFRRPLAVLEFLVAAVCSHKVISNNPISQSAWLYRWLYRRKRGEVISNAVRKPLEVRQCSAPGNAPKHVRLLYAGRLTPQKNVQLLIRALGQLNRRSDWHLSIYGQGELESELKQLAVEVGIERNVTFAGYTSELPRVMVESDLMVLPSLYEGMPNVLLESLSVGLPTLASDIPANRLALTELDCVGWFAVDDATGLAASIRQFLDNPVAFHERIAAGFALAERYSEEAMSDAYARTYREVVST